MASLDITVVSAAVLTAPTILWFEAVNPSGFAPGGPAMGETYDPRLHEITYIWTVRGAPFAPYSAPQNIVAEWNNANRAYGPKVALHFPQPGTYTVDLWATDQQGNTGAAETTVVIADPDTEYPGVRSVCFSNDAGETWAGEIPGCQRITSIPALQAAITGAAQPLRVLFKSGQTVINGDFRFDNNEVQYVGAWGSGAKPVLHMTTITSGFGMDQCTVSGLRFTGDWDSTTETGALKDPLNHRVTGTEIWFQTVGCEFDGVHGYTASSGISAGGQVSMADCVITNWKTIGYYIGNMSAANNPNSRVAVLGCRLQQHVDARNGQADASGNYLGPLRIADCPTNYIAACDMLSRNGWSAATPDIADQPCFRVNSASTNGTYVNIERVVCEGGGTAAALTNGETGPDAVGNYIIDKLLVLGTAKSLWSLIGCDFDGTTMRNVLGVMPNVPHYHPIRLDSAIDIGTKDGLHDENLAIYSSTFINLRDTGNDLNGDNWIITVGDADWGDLVIENNVMHAPDTDAPVTGDGPIDLSSEIAEIVPRYKGVWFEGDVSINMTYSSFGQAVPAAVPQPGSLAYRGATTGRVAYDDFFGNVRGPTPSRGAIEPA